MAKGKYEQWLTEEGLLKIEGWARDGLTDKQIASNTGVSYSTFREWVKKFPALSAPLKRGKDVVDRQIENAMVKNALGYQYDEVTRESIWNDDLKKFELRTTKVVTKEVKADTTAQIFWLKNRKPLDWRDKKETELSGGVEVTNPYEGLTTEELRKLARSEKRE